MALAVAAVLLAGCGGVSPPASQAATWSGAPVDAVGPEAAAAESGEAAVVPSVGSQPSGPDVDPSAAEPPSGPDGDGAAADRQSAAEEAGPALEGCLAEAPSPPADAQRILVTRAVDGDTLAFADGTRVRLIGINTPESVDPRRPVQAYGKEASAYTQQLTANQEVLYVPGQTPRDRYGRLLAWVWLADGTFLNALLVRDGYAQVYTFADNPDHADLLLACQREAREANRGLWALPEYQDGQMAAEMDREPGSGEPSGAGEAAEALAAGEAAALAGEAAEAAAAGEAAALAITQEPGVVSRGAKATVSVRTRAGVTCSISVIYKSGPSTAKGLEPKQADAAGVVSWSWTVGTRTTPGTWPVIITCGGETVRTAVTVP